MRALFVFVLSGSLIFAQSDADKKIRIEGTVESTTGGPVQKATVRLVQGPNTPVALTDDAGKFVFENLKAGAYQMRAERAGFQTQFYGSKIANGLGTPLNLKEGDKLTGLTIQMIPQGGIEGRVLGPDGDPVARVRVQAMDYSYESGQRRLLTEATGATTDDQGNYRIAGLAPGTYFLKAERPATPTSLVATYYPNSFDLRGAAPVYVYAGAEQGGITIRARQEKLYSIRGTVSGPTGQPVRATIATLPKGEMVPISSRGIGPNGNRLLDASTPLGPSQLQTAQDGTFVLRDLRPGTYTVVAAEGSGSRSSKGTDGSFSMRMGTDGSPTGRVEVTLGNEDAKIDIRLAAGMDIRGRFKVEDGNFEEDFPANVLSPRIEVQALEGLTVNLPSARAELDGTFVLKGTPTGQYLVTVLPVPSGYYVKSMRFGSQDLLRSPLDVSVGSGEMEVVLSEKTGVVGGSVVESQGRASSGASVSLWARGSSSVRIAKTDQNGAFQFKNVAPDEYALVAFEELPDAGLAQYAPFLAAFSGEATHIKLEPSGHVSGNIKLISREKAAAEVAKLP